MAVMGFVPFFLAFILLSQLISFGEDQQKENPHCGDDDGVGGRHGAPQYIDPVWLSAVGPGSAFGFTLGYGLAGVLNCSPGLLEIWLMERVRRGQKPLWRIMQVAMGAVFLLPAYLLTLTFWIH